MRILEKVTSFVTQRMQKKNESNFLKLLMKFYNRLTLHGHSIMKMLRDIFVRYIIIN